MSTESTRLVDLEGCLNFRDLGGYPSADGREIRWRLLFRSDALHALTPDDIRRVREELNVTDLVDLRSTAELASEGRGLLEHEPIAFHHTPLFDGDRREGERNAMMDLTTLGARYFGLLEVAKGPIARVVELLAAAEGGAVYHCAAGKDRTGVISAVLLGTLGVRDELIIADYALTQQNLDAIMARLNAMEGYKDMLDALPPDTQHAEPETMVELLGRVNETYGSMSGYLEAAGVAPDTLERLRDRLLA